MKNPDYTFGIASLEIVILLLLAFALGMLLCWLLRKIGICCNTSNNGDVSTNYPSAPDSKGSYTADINTLLRSSSHPADHLGSRLTSATGLATDIGATAAATVGGFASDILHLGEGRKDDLKKLEGIGPKIEQILNAAGIQNFDQLAALTPDVIKPLLEKAGNQFRMHDPKSWPYQAELAAKGEWERLKEYQNLLIGWQAS